MKQNYYYGINLIKRNNIYEKNNKDKKVDYIYPEFLKNKNFLCKLDCFIIVPEFVYNYFIIKNNKTQKISDIENSKINDIKENMMDDNADYIVFRENDDPDDLNEIQKDSDTEPENDNIEKSKNLINEKSKNNKESNKNVKKVKKMKKK